VSNDYLRASLSTRRITDRQPGIREEISPMKSGILPGVLALLVLTTSLALAKGPPDKVVISGPGLSGEVESTDCVAISVLGLGSLEDFQRGPIAAPQVSTGYQLTRYFKDGASYRPFDRLIYYPNRSGERGYIFYEGLRVSGGWSEYDGKWFYATKAGDAAMRRLLKQLGAAPATLPATGGTAAPLEAVVALGGALALAGALLRFRQKVR